MFISGVHTSELRVVAVVAVVKVVVVASELGTPGVPAACCTAATIRDATNYTKNKIHKNAFGCGFDSKSQ